MTPNNDGKARSGAVAPYYVLYFTERSSDGFMGPLKRARYASVHEAVERAHGMRHNSQLSPIEVRDQQDGLITCALMGWRVPPLHRSEQATDVTSAMPAEDGTYR